MSEIDRIDRIAPSDLKVDRSSHRDGGNRKSKSQLHDVVELHDLEGEVVPAELPDQDGHLDIAV